MSICAQQEYEWSTFGLPAFDKKRRSRKKKARLKKAIFLLALFLLFAVFLWWVTPDNDFLAGKYLLIRGKRFNSITDLEAFLRRDNLNERTPSASYTCINFARDFIRRAEAKGYDCFTFCTLHGDDMKRFKEALGTIKVAKRRSEEVEIIDYSYFVTMEDVAHAVVKTTVGNVEVIVDPQTDVILASNDFTVIYEGEILYDDSP